MKIEKIKKKLLGYRGFKIISDNKIEEYLVEEDKIIEKSTGQSQTIEEFEKKLEKMKKFLIIAKK